jgi:hypothetical protein
VNPFQEVKRIANHDRVFERGKQEWRTARSGRDLQLKSSRQSRRNHPISDSSIDHENPNEVKRNKHSSGQSRESVATKKGL